MGHFVNKNQAGFLYIELILSLSIIAMFFTAIMPKILLTEKMKVDAQAQHLISSLRFIQQKSFSMPHETKAAYTPYIVINDNSYEVYEQPPAQPVIISMPDGITLKSNNKRTFSFNRGDNYTASAATITVAGKNYSAKVTVHSYGRIRIAD